MFESKDIKERIRVGIVLAVITCMGIAAFGTFAVVNLTPGSNDSLLILGVFLTLIPLILTCVAFYDSKTPGGIPILEPYDYFNDKGKAMAPVFHLINLIDNQWIALMANPIQNDAFVPISAEIVVIRHLDFQPKDRLVIESLFRKNRIAGKMTTIKIVAMPVTSGYVFTLVPNSDTEA